MKTKQNNLLIVGDEQWAKSLPEWLLKEVEAERLIIGMCDVIGKKRFKDSDMVGDAEVCVYLFTASLRDPLNSNFVDIYSHLAHKIVKKRNSKIDLQGVSKELTVYQYDLLIDLKSRIFTSRGGKIKSPLLDIVKNLKKQNMEENNGRKKVS